MCMLSLYVLLLLLLLLFIIIIVSLHCITLYILYLYATDVDNLLDPTSVRERQERVLDAFVSYTCEHYTFLPYKVSQLLAKLPELSRTCLLAKELLEPHQRSGKVPTQSLLNELLRGDAGMRWVCCGSAVGGVFFYSVGPLGGSVNLRVMFRDVRVLWFRAAFQVHREVWGVSLSAVFF